jgi:hypothetical protein
MTSRRRNSNKNLGNSISDVRRRLKYLERKPVRTKLQNRVIKAAAIAPSSITADEVDFGTTVITNENPADVIDNPKEGLLVVDPDTGAGQLYSEQEGNYVEITDATARTTADGKNTIYAQTTAPSGASLKTNDIWYDTDDGNKLYVWNGTAWVNIQDTAIAAAASAATAAQTTADGKNSVYRQDAQPTGGTYVSGDLWFDTDDNNKIYRYSGSAWVALQLGGNALANISANSITTGTIDASAITVSFINASNISTGTLAAARIAANSLDVNVLQAGTLRAGTVYSGNIVASQITTGTITAAVEMTSATITGALIRQATSGTRIELNSANPGRISFYTTTTNPGVIELTTDPTSGASTVIIYAPYDTGTPGYISMAQGSGSSFLSIKANSGVFQTGSLGLTYLNDVSSLLSIFRNIGASTSLPAASSVYNGSIYLVYT